MEPYYQHIRKKWTPYLDINEKAEEQIPFSTWTLWKEAWGDPTRPWEDRVSGDEDKQQSGVSVWRNAGRLQSESTLFSRSLAWLLAGHIVGLKVSPYSCRCVSDLQPIPDNKGFFYPQQEASQSELGSTFPGGKWRQALSSLTAAFGRILLLQDPRKTKILSLPLSQLSSFLLALQVSKTTQGHEICAIILRDIASLVKLVLHFSGLLRGR